MRAAIIKFGATVVPFAAMAFLISCGGGNSNPPAPTPPPPPLTLTTASLPGAFYSEFYSVTLQASGGTGARTWTVSAGSLPLGLNLDHGSGIISGVVSDTSLGSISFEITVRDSASGTVTKSFGLNVDQRGGRILTTSLPDAVLGRQYRMRLATNQPNGLIEVDLSQGAPPPGISVGTVLIGPEAQSISGTPTVAGTFSFVIQFLAQPATQRRFTLRVVGPGTTNRNDDTTNAPALSSGTYFASISPLTDPLTNPIPEPDNDFYKLTAQPGATVSIEITSERFGTPLDSVIELVDSTGTRLSTCNSPGESSFANPCMDDDNLEEGTLDSKLLFRAPSGGPTTFFLHVLDWRGDARPDMTYQFQIFGAD